MIATRINRGLISQTGQIPSGLHFLQDSFPLKILDRRSTVSESKGIEGRPTLKITGIFQKADDENQNGRVYPYKVISEAVKSIQDDVKNRGVMGEYDHPQDAKIHLDRVSHLITKLWMEGKYVYGEAEVLDDMPFGSQLATLLKHKVQIGISSRGVGDMEVVNEGSREKYMVQPGYQFVTWDIVGEPSVREAVMHVMESKNRLVTRSIRKSVSPAGSLVSELNQWLKNK